MWPWPYPFLPQFPQLGKGATGTLSATLQFFARTGEIRVTLAFSPPNPFQPVPPSPPRPPPTQGCSRRPLLTPPSLSPKVLPGRQVEEMEHLEGHGWTAPLPPGSARLSLSASSSWKPTMGLPALTTETERLLVQICLHSSLEQLRTEPHKATYFFNVY